MTEVDASGAWVPTETNDIENSELWSLDATLTDYIIPRIKAFRRMKRHGYPVLGKDIDTNSNSSSADEELKEAEWENILFDIEKGFEAHKKIQSDVVLGQALGEDPTHNVEALHETMQKGLQLFAKHYDHLWD